MANVPDHHDLILQYRGMALKLAETFARRYYPKVPFDDARSAAFEGLTVAATRFDPTRGIQFSTFAYYRIRGAILDDARRNDRLPKKLRVELAIEAALNEAIEQTSETVVLMASPADDRVQAAAGLSQILEVTAASALVQVVLDDETPDPSELGRSPEELAERNQIALLLREAIPSLPEPERTVIQGIYLEGKSLDEIAAPLNLSRSWTSRVGTRALELLRVRLRAAVGGT